MTAPALQRNINARTSALLVSQLAAEEAGNCGNAPRFWECLAEYLAPHLPKAKAKEAPIRRPEKPRTLDPADRRAWEDAVDQCDGILEDLERMMEMTLSPDGHDFADSVRGKVEGIRESIDEYESVTEGQQNALDNMGAAVNKWLHE